MSDKLVRVSSFLTRVKDVSVSSNWAWNRLEREAKNENDRSTHAMYANMDRDQEKTAVSVLNIRNLSGNGGGDKMEIV